MMGGDRLKASHRLVWWESKTTEPAFALARLKSALAVMKASFA